MGDQWFPLLFVGVAVSTVAMIVFITFSQFVRASRKSKRADGVSGLVANQYAQTAALPSSRQYPGLAPIWKTQILLWVGVGVSLLGLLLIGGGWFAQQDHIRQVRLLESEGVAATARITDKTISSSDDSDTYYIHYTFTALVDDQRVEINRKISVSEQFYDRVEYGGSLPIIYARSDPRVVRIQALYTPGKVEYWRLIILGGLGMLCCWLAWRIFKTYGDARRLDNEGVQATVRVLECYVDDSDSDSTWYYVIYELPGFGPIRQSVDVGRYRQLTVGDRVRVTYLPDQPKIFRPQWD